MTRLLYSNSFLTCAQVLTAGESVFTLECEGGKSADISCSTTEIADIVAFLVRGAAIATEQSCSALPPPSNSEPIELEPAPALGLAFAPGRSPEETFLLIHTAGVYLGFSVPSSGLA